ncbi:MAG: transposase [Deltaproteobacteria bacterium]|nr:transposase [Deltaproteobacteria bacterium]
MGTIADIFREYGPEYLETYQESIPVLHRKVMGAIIGCRTEVCGVNVYSCKQCNKSMVVFRSCGNRHCPTCQNHKTRQWLERQLNRELPGHHFMVTFTVPQQLRRFIRSHQRTAYSALFSASSAALKILSADEEFVGGNCPGFFGVLHTWGRQLDYHPHIHYIVPGGAFDKESGNWHSSRVDFYVPVSALSKIFRARLRDEMKKAGLFDQIDPIVWNIDWNVNCQAIGSSEGSLKYLAPYVFKVAITDSRIVKVENRQVTLRYKKQKSSRWRTMTLEVMEFIRRYLQHVLPTGFMKIRYYGFMGSGSSLTLDDISAAIELSLDVFVECRQVPKYKGKASPYCPHCGGKLEYWCSIRPHERWQPG